MAVFRPPQLTDFIEVVLVSWFFQSVFLPGCCVFSAVATSEANAMCRVRQLLNKEQK